MRRILTISLVAASVLVPATAAQGASSLIATVRGFGHGVGLSQYGTLGYAQHGWTADRILAHYYTGTQLGRLGTAPVVRVLLQNAHSQYSISGASSVGGQLLDRSKTYTVVARPRGPRRARRRQGPLHLAGADAPAPRLRRRRHARRAGAERHERRRLPRRDRGRRRRGRACPRSTSLSLEDYVAGVVSAEVPASWPDEALRAQAVAARTYAVTTNAGGSAGNFTQYADTRSQMYRGVAAETATTGAAVRATAGRVVTYQGKPVATFFFSTSGGRTENVENSFVGSDPKPWLKSVADPYDTVSPYHRPQSIRMTLTRATRSLGGLVKGRLKQIRVLKRGVSPRIVRAGVVGTAGTTTVTGPQLRRAFGLRDTWIRFRSFSTDVSKQPAPPVGGQLPSVPAIPRTTPVDPTTGGAQTSAVGLRIHGVIAPATARRLGERRAPHRQRAGCAPSTSRSPAAARTRRRSPARAPTACGTAARRGPAVTAR